MDVRPTARPHPSRDPLKLRNSARVLRRGRQGKTKRKRTLLATEPGRRTDCSQTRGCRDKRPQRRGGRFSHRTPGSAAGGHPVQASFRPGCAWENEALPAGPALPAVLRSHCSRNTRGCGHGHSADPQASPDTPVRGPLLHLEQASPRDSDAHGCLRTMSQDPSLTFPATLTSTCKRTLPEAV